MISFNDVEKKYPDGTLAVADLTLQVPTGKITVFVGPSGCGKTTSLRMINRMIEPTSGTISIDGRNIQDTNAAQLRRGIGYVIQNVGLFPHRTIVDNVATVPVLNGLGRRQARIAATELLTRVGLDPRLATRYPAQLSGGQQQRVGVARALAADPPILLMDEPFSAVDPVVRAQLQDEMLHLQEELGKTVVFVTHDIDEALRLGDLVVVFAPGGRVAQADEPALLLEAPSDDFVSDFVGRDRGYRALSFTAGGRLPTVPAIVIEASVVDDLLAQRADAPDIDPAVRWAVFADANRHPLGWVDCRGLHAGRPLTQHDLRYTTSLIRPGSSLRATLDAALSSPGGDGIVVDESGALVGLAPSRAILDAVEASWEPSAAPATQVAP